MTGSPIRTSYGAKWSKKTQTMSIKTGFRAIILGEVLRKLKFKYLATIMEKIATNNYYISYIIPFCLSSDFSRFEYR